MSPTEFKERCCRCFFFSREEERKHKHIVARDGEARYWLEPEIELARNYRFTSKQLKDIKTWSRIITMSSLAHGDSTSKAEVTNISVHGVWLLAHGKELFMPYEEFPWFKDVPVKSIFNVEEVSPGHFYWSDLDVDLTEEDIKHPESFPLRSGVRIRALTPFSLLIRCH